MKTLKILLAFLLLLFAIDTFIVQEIRISKLESQLKDVRHTIDYHSKVVSDLETDSTNHTERIDHLTVAVIEVAKSGTMNSKAIEDLGQAVINIARRQHP